MGKSKDKKDKREAKEEKNLALGVKRKQLKRKKDRGLDRAVEGEATAKNEAKEGKELARRKKMALMKEKKKTKHAKVKSNHAMADSVVELISENKDEATPKLKKLKRKSKMKAIESSKMKAIESSSPVKLSESSSVSDGAEASKLKKKKKKVKEGKSIPGSNESEQTRHENQDEDPQKSQSEDMDNRNSEKAKRGKKIKTKKVKKSGKSNKTDEQAASEKNNMEMHVEGSTADADEIPSVDEDCSQGMKKWLLEYKKKRPGLKILQERIDEFMTAHDEQQEKERKEREARAAEEGWTVVVHHKGRKKTTDEQTGTAVGSVSLAAMQEKMANKKPKEVATNFYRFQKREAHLSEAAMVRSKFEQDKKRIQELRAQRKFKPY